MFEDVNTPLSKMMYTSKGRKREQSHSLQLWKN